MRRVTLLALIALLYALGNVWAQTQPRVVNTEIVLCWKNADGSCAPREEHQPIAGCQVYARKVLSALLVKPDGGRILIQTPVKGTELPDVPGKYVVTCAALGLQAEDLEWGSRLLVQRNP